MKQEELDNLVILSNFWVNFRCFMLIALIFYNLATIYYSDEFVCFTAFPSIQFTIVLPAFLSISWLLPSL